MAFAVGPASIRLLVGTKGNIIMRALGTVAVLLFTGLSITACTPPPVDDLGAQLKIEQWTFWMMVTGAASSFFAMISAWALFWTFAEQRKMVLAIEQADITITGVVGQHLESEAKAARHTGNIEVDHRENVLRPEPIPPSFASADVLRAR